LQPNAFRHRDAEAGSQRKPGPSPSSRQRSWQVLKFNALFRFLHAKGCRPGEATTLTADALAVLLVQRQRHETGRLFRTSNEATDFSLATRDAPADKGRVGERGCPLRTRRDTPSRSREPCVVAR